MVMRLAGEEAAHTDAGRAFVGMLDTSEGADMANHIAARWPHARTHFVLRKWQLWTWMGALAINTPALGRQVVVLGAGWSPLGVDWAHRAPDACVWEVDQHHQGAKEALIHRLFPTIGARVRGVSADLANLGSLLPALRAAGWRAELPTLWVAEGLSYYLPMQPFAALLRAGLTFDPSNRAIVEFGLPPAMLREDVRQRTSDYHGYLAASVGQAALHTVDPSELCYTSGALPLAWADPSSIEAARNGRAIAFTSPDESGMRMAVMGPA